MATQVLSAGGAMTPQLTAREFTEFRVLIGRVAGITLPEAKAQLIASRLARRLRHHGYGTYGEYYEHLTHRDPDGSEMREMVNCITTNKTSFFREAHHFDTLRGRVFARAPRAGAPVRLWSAGCSTGEEPYTMAMTALEHFGPDAARRVQIVATDIDTQVLATAAAGVYPAATLEGVPVPLRRRYFLRGTGARAGSVRVCPEARALVTFRHVNLMDTSWPVAGGLDAIFCRNVIIYFDAETRRRLIERFAALLQPSAHLMLGHSESLPSDQRLFAPLHHTTYVRAGGPAAGTPAVREPAPPPAAMPREAQPPETRIVAGGVFASATPTVVKTLLGSCVAACLYDPVAGVGGMNHFLLPDDLSDGPPVAPDAAARYGVHAMEMLINEIMRLGGDRRRLEAKAFGGASVLGLTHAGVSGQNVRFITEFLAREGIPLRAHRLGGTAPLDVHLHTAEGRVRVRALDTRAARRAAADEQRYRREAQRQLAAGNAPAAVTLF